MISSVALLLVALSATLALPASPVYYQPQYGYQPQPQYVPRVAAPVPVGAVSANPEGRAAIVQQYRDQGFQGDFNYGFDSDNGLSVKSKGYLKPPVGPDQQPIQAIEGSYSYVNQAGKPETIHYIADENGYRAYGDSIPQPPGPEPAAAAPSS